MKSSRESLMSIIEFERTHRARNEHQIRQLEHEISRLHSELQEMQVRYENLLGAKASHLQQNMKTKPNILIVDDNPIVQVTANTMLNSLGFNVITANNGQQACDILNEENCSIVFMDCQMPIMDGFQATQMIRHQFRGNKAPAIIALTANDSEENKKKCMAAGMNDFISKPFVLEDIRRVLNNYTHNKSAA